jgi:hypothetical protein
MLTIAVAWIPVAKVAAESDRPVLSVEVQRALDVSLTGRTFSDAINRFVAAHSGGMRGDALDAYVTAVVDGVDKGCEPDLLTKQSEQYYSVIGMLLVDKAGQARFAALVDLLMRLQSRSDRAHARAMCILLAQDRAMLGARMLSGHLLRDDFLMALSGTESQRKRLRELGTRLLETQRAAFPFQKSVSGSLRSLIDSPKDESAWDRLAPKFVGHLVEGWRCAGDDLVIKHSLAAEAWRLACLARANGRNPACCARRGDREPSIDGGGPHRDPLA